MGKLGKSRRRAGQLAALGGAVAVLAATLSISNAVRNDKPSNQAFLDHINDRSSANFPNHYTTGIFLGTGETQDEANDLLALWKEKGVLNPFTSRPFADTKVFAFGSPAVPVEALRVFADNVGVFVLSSWRELKGYRFDYIICHSDGCTNAIAAIREGLIKADYIFALGANWTYKDIPPGSLRGAKLIFFVMEGDPVPELLAGDIDRVGNTPVVRVTITRFDSPWGLVKGIWKRLTGGRPDDIPVIVLKQPEDLRGGPLRAHSLVAAYFKAILAKMKQGGPEPEIGQIKESLDGVADRQTETDQTAENRDRSQEEDKDKDDEEDKGKPPDDPPGCPPFCPPPPNQRGQQDPSSGPGQFPRDTIRGGVYAGVPVEEKDIATPSDRRKR